MRHETSPSFHRSCSLYKDSVCGAWLVAVWLWGLCLCVLRSGLGSVQRRRWWEFVSLPWAQRAGNLRVMTFAMWCRAALYMWCLPTQDWKSPISSTSQPSHPWKSLDFTVCFVTLVFLTQPQFQSLPFMNSPCSLSSSVAASCRLSCFYPVARRVFFHHFSPFLKGTGQKEKHPKIHQPFFTDALEQLTHPQAVPLSCQSRVWRRMLFQIALWL